MFLPKPLFVLLQESKTMFDKISRHLWILTTCFFSAVLTLACFRIIQFQYYPVNFKFTVEELTDYEIRPKQYTLDFYDRAKDKLGDDYSDAISYAKNRVRNNIKGYKENNKPSEVLEVKVDTTTMVETRTYNTHNDIPIAMLYCIYLLRPKSISCLLYTSPSPRDRQKSRMPSSA